MAGLDSSVMPKKGELTLQSELQLNGPVTNLAVQPVGGVKVVFSRTSIFTCPAEPAAIHLVLYGKKKEKASTIWEIASRIPNDVI